MISCFQTATASTSSSSDIWTFCDVGLWVEAMLGATDLDSKLSILKRIRGVRMSSEVAHEAIQHLYNVDFPAAIWRAKLRVINFLVKKYPKPVSASKKMLKVSYLFKGKKMLIDVPEGETIDGLQERIEARHKEKIVIVRFGKCIAGALSRGLRVNDNIIYKCVLMIKR